MKVLLTGMTPLHRNTKHRTIQKIDVPEAIARILAEAGVQVDWRSVDVGNYQAGDYDLQIVCVMPLMSVGVREGLGGWLRLAVDMPTIAFFDDWKLRQFISNCRTMIKKGPREGVLRKAFGSTFFTGATEAELLAAGPTVVELAERFVTDQWSPQWLASWSSFSWGDPLRAMEFLSPNRVVHPFSPVDPSYLAEDVVAKAKQRLDLNAMRDSRREEWTLSILTDMKAWVDKLNPTWPVAYYGNKKYGTRLPSEMDVAASYGMRWGALAPPYHHYGSGWFRSRFVYSALMGSIIVGDPRDLAPLGPAYQHSVREIEGLSSDDLRRVADQQQQAFLPYLTGKWDFAEGVLKMIKRADAQYRGAHA